jgi:urea transport system ATP-binding protein
VVAEIEEVIVDLTRRGDLTVLLVEQHVGFALRSTDSYYVLESGRITGSGEGGEAALDEVRASMAL